MVTERISNLDRRVIYLIVIVLASYIVLVPLGLPLPISTRTQNFYDIIEALPDGSSAILQIESGTAEIGVPEQLPILIAAVKHMTSKHFKLVFWSGMSIDDSNLLVDVLIANGEFPLTAEGYVYGTDWCNIGWIGGSEPGLTQFAGDISGFKPQDAYNNLLETMPIFNDLKTINDFDLWFVMCREADTPAAAMRAIQAPYNVQPMLVTSSSLAGQFQAYVTAGQGKEVVFGARGAAEYEKLIGKPGLGLSTVDALSTLAILCMVFIVIGNLADFAKKGGKIGRVAKQSKEEG